MARSLNGATIRIQEKAGRKNVRAMAQKLGLVKTPTSGPAVGLGVDGVSPLGLSGAYAAFANGGFRVEPHLIQSIQTDDGRVLFKRDVFFYEQVASRRAINRLDSSLESVVQWGTGRAANAPGYRAAGKTGTTQNSRDAWFAGYTEDYVCVVWVGRDDNSPMKGVTGGGAPAQIWREIMTRTSSGSYLAAAASPR